MFEQGAAISRASGRPETYVAKERSVQEKLFALARQAPDSAAAVNGVRGVFRAEGLDSATVAAQLPSSAAFVRSRWFRFFLDYDPRPALRGLKCPVLALNGSLDTQVPSKQNLPEIDSALRAAGNHDFETRELPRLNHLFQTATTGSPGEYSTIEETFSPVALTAMREWIVKHELPGARE